MDGGTTMTNGIAQLQDNHGVDAEYFAEMHTSVYAAYGVVQA